MCWYQSPLPVRKEEFVGVGVTTRPSMLATSVVYGVYCAHPLRPICGDFGCQGIQDGQSCPHDFGVMSVRFHGYDASDNLTSIGYFDGFACLHFPKSLTLMLL